MSRLCNQQMSPWHLEGKLDLINSFKYSNETCKWVIDGHNPTASFDQKLLHFKRFLALFWEALCYHDEVTTGDIIKDVNMKTRTLEPGLIIRLEDMNALMSYTLSFTC